MRLKILQIIFSLAIGLLAGPAQSIGLGKLSANSVLGEPLHVTIPLLSVSPAQLEDLKVRLATAGVYSALGWPYPRSAGEMKFEVESHTEGEATIFITTQSKISQTILPLVIQVRWSGGGQLQRDFMVLLDPPEYGIALSEANIPSTASSSISDSGAATTSDEITTTALDIPVATSATVIIEPATQVPSQSNAESQAGTNSRVVRALENGGVIEVIRGDSLSKIAEMFLQQGATMYQARVAFFDANPQAFVNNNINLIKSGHRLTIPSEETILSYSRDEAKLRYSDLVTTPSAPVSTEVSESQSTTEDDIPESQTSNTTAPETQESVTEETGTVEPENAEMASEETAGSDDIADGDDQTASGTEEFGLQVLPVESEVIASTESQESPGINQTNEAQKSQDELLDTFNMQGFSTRIKYMDAYLLELQDENQLLKDKVDSLEKTVGLLVNFVPIDGLSPEQQAALENLRDDFSGSEIMGSGAEEDAADEISVNTTVDSDLAAISTTEETASDDPSQPDMQSVLPAADPTNIQGQENNQIQASNQNQVNDSAAEITETVTGDIALASANVDQFTEPESKATIINAETGNSTVQPESNPNRVKIEGGWSTQIQELVNNQYFLPVVALIIVAGLLYRRKRVRDDAEVSDRLRMDPQVNTPDASSLSEDSQPVSSQYIKRAEPGQGVTYLEPDEQDNTFLSDDIFSSEEVERNQESEKAEIAPEEIDMPQDHKLDSITESDVFMKYDRPDLAIQVLEDAYRNGTGNQGLVALKLIDVHESLSGKTDTDSSFKNFIQKLYTDIDKFDNNTWEKIAARIDKTETS